MSQFACPLCGKFQSLRYYSPEDFDTEINIVKVRGLGRGRGVEVVERYSIFGSGNEELVDKIGDRVAVLYDLFWEDDLDDEDDEILEDEEFLTELEEEEGTTEDALLDRYLQSEPE